MKRPIQKVTVKEVKNIILKNLNATKASGFDLIIGMLLKELPQKAIRFLTIIFNIILKLSYFPVLWKVAQIILIPKLGKEPEELTSYSYY